MVVRIVVVGSGVTDPVHYPDGSNTDKVEKKLSAAFGNGLLKLNGEGVLADILAAGEYEYHVTPQGRKSIIFFHSFYSTLICLILSLISTCYVHTLI